MICSVWRAIRDYKQKSAVFVGIYDIWPWQTQQKTKKISSLAKNLKSWNTGSLELIYWKQRLYFHVKSITLPLALNQTKQGHLLANPINQQIARNQSLYLLFIYVHEKNFKMPPKKKVRRHFTHNTIQNKDEIMQNLYSIHHDTNSRINCKWSCCFIT